MKWVAMISFVLGIVVSGGLFGIFLIGSAANENPTDFALRIVVCEACVGIAPMVMGIGLLAFSKENFNA